jgi:hypothetical protein
MFLKLFSRARYSIKIKKTKVLTEIAEKKYMA